jgi:hypothetical protein
MRILPHGSVSLFAAVMKLPASADFSRPHCASGLLRNATEPAMVINFTGAA